jgi:hypothetical protein
MSNPEREKRRISNKTALGIGSLALAFAIGGTAIRCSSEQERGESEPSKGPTLTLEPSLVPSPIDVATPIPVETPTATEHETKDGSVVLGTEESNLSLQPLGISWTPDGHIPYISLSNGQKRFFTVGPNKTFIIATPGLSLQEAVEQNLLESQRNVREVLGRAQNPEYNYSGITGVFQLNAENENHLTAVLHQEEWATETNGSGFRASVGVFESFDAGLTWTNGRTIMRGQDIAEPGERVSGAGQPGAIQVGEYLYIYHIDWSAQKVIQHPDQIYLARAKVVNGTLDNNIEYYTGNGFSSYNLEMQPVIPVPSNIDNAVYSALPSVSWNNYLGKYLVVFETNVGFAQATSVDGLNWSESELILEFPQPQSERETTDVWLSYPTLVSDDNEPNDHATGKTGRLYYSKGHWNATSHNMVSVPFEIK